MANNKRRAAAPKKGTREARVEGTIVTQIPGIARCKTRLKACLSPRPGLGDFLVPPNTAGDG